MSVLFILGQRSNDDDLLLFFFMQTRSSNASSANSASGDFDIAYVLEVALHKSALVTALNSSLFMQFLSVFEKVIARPVTNITEIDLLH